ncbi:AAA family ATPase [Cereibacter johrii]|uniref:AAA family ATPase n=1 Tax=Cereibacter johrii TaxID=445629 RepID=UPI00167C56A4|nr:AAA family ATPase [Cereibacter johrii]
MIENIYLANEGAYDATGTKLEGLRKLNFIFGSNGSGKTTISRVIEGSGTFPDCQVTWAGGSPLETRVYNKDFVEKHFDAESRLKGIYTFGENVVVAEKIKTLKGEADAIKSELHRLRKVLSGDDGTSGKQKEREVLATQFLEDVWIAKGKLSDLKDAFTGLNNDKKKFRDRYLIEASSNFATVRDTAEVGKTPRLCSRGR